MFLRSAWLKVVGGLGLVMAISTASPAATVGVQVSDYVGMRTSAPGGGITATDGWGNGGFELSWDISLNPSTDKFTYTYTISGANGQILTKGLSHLILEVTQGSTAANFDADVSFASDSPRVFTSSDPGNSNPGLPGDIFGLKWNTTDENDSIFIVTIETLNEPVWGNFYAKDGVDLSSGSTIDVIAYNDNFTFEPETTTTDFTGWIARPNGDPSFGVVPLPASYWMGLTLLGTVWLVKAFRFGVWTRLTASDRQH